MSGTDDRSMTRATRKSLRVLVVEDSDADAYVLQKYLGDLGCKVVAWVKFGHEAVELVDRERPDVVFMDLLLMGDMDGVEATRRIQARHAIPIVFVTVGAPDDAALGPAAGRNLYLRKPYSRGDLRAVLTAAATQGEALSSEVFALYDRQRRRVIYLSPSYETVFGRPAEYVMSDPLAWLDAVVEAQRRDIRRRLRHNDPEIHFRIVASDGSERSIRARFFAVPDGTRGGDALTAVVAEDVTREQQLEMQLRQAQKLESLGRLAGGVAHDFNNLLNVMMGYTDIALSVRDLDPTAYKALQEILSAGERAASLSRQLLTFARQQTVRAVVVDLHTVIEDSARMLSHLLGSNIELETSLESSAHYVRADEGQLQQVIVNLCINARDAMPAGGRLLLRTRTVRSRNVGSQSIVFNERESSRADPQFIEIQVIDSGHGMDEATLKQIFDPFFTTKGALGTGLGLANVYEIVKQNGGEIRVESQMGSGSTFTIVLPATESKPAPAPHVLSNGPASAGSGTILLVEDDEQLSRFVAIVLEREGYTVLRARDGQEGNEVAVRFDGSIDLLLTDVVMPGMSGPDLVNAISSCRPRTRVLYMSGYGEEQLTRFGGRAERQLLCKPFTPRVLLSEVRAALSLRGDRDVNVS